MKYGMERNNADRSDTLSELVVIATADVVCSTSFCWRASVGAVVGRVDGSIEGDIVGTPDGSIEGSIEGAVVGLSVGLYDGHCVDKVGSNVVVVCSVTWQLNALYASVCG